jgi:hypothetical protein
LSEEERIYFLTEDPLQNRDISWAIRDISRETVKYDWERTLSPFFDQRRANFAFGSVFAHMDTISTESGANSMESQQMQTQSASKGSRVTKEGMEAFLDWLEVNGLPTLEVWLSDDRGFMLHRPEVGPLPRHERSATGVCVAG